MKKNKYLLSISGALILTLMFISPESAESATLDLNGSVIDIEKSDGDVFLENGTTMISENILRDDLFLNIEKSGKQFSLKNSQDDFCIEGVVGENTLSFNEETISMPVNVREKNGIIYFPLRSLLEHFGTVEWNGKKQVITVRYDYNDQMILPEVTVADQPVQYEILTDLGSEINTDSKLIRQTDQGILCEKITELNYVTAVTLDGKALIKPLHEQHIILDRCYAVEDDYLYWIEHPDPTLETTEDQQWYLYLQERTDGSEPICVDQGNFGELQNIDFGEYILQNCDFQRGNIIWLRGDGVTKELQVRLYQHETGETKILESASLQKHPDITMEVELGENDAIWTTSHIVENARQYSTMYRYNLDSQKCEVFSEGFNLSNPVITGDYLIIRSKPEGSNFIVNEETGEYQSGLLWVYDLSNDQWKFQVTPNFPEWEDNLILTIPSVLDNTHIVLNIQGEHKKNKMAVVNLQNAQAYYIENDEGTPLYHGRYGDELVVETQALGSDSTSMMTFMKHADSDIVYQTYPVYIEW